MTEGLICQQVFRFPTKVGDDRMKMQIVKIEWNETVRYGEIRMASSTSVSPADRSVCCR